MRKVACIQLFSAASGTEAPPAQFGRSADVAGSGREGPDGEGWKTEPAKPCRRPAPK